MLFGANYSRFSVMQAAMIAKLVFHCGLCVQLLSKKVMKGRVIILVWYALIMFVLMALEGIGQHRVMLKNGEVINGLSCIDWNLKTDRLLILRDSTELFISKSYIQFIETDSSRIQFSMSGEPCYLKVRGLRDEDATCTDKNASEVQWNL